MEPDGYEGLEARAKRRRLRKGTHSCWECKRRKVRCMFSSPTDATCITCRRRGARCVGQEVPEELCQIDDGVNTMVRVEAVLHQLVRKIDHGAARNGTYSASGEGRRPKPASPKPASDSGSTPFMPLYEPSSERFAGGTDSAATPHSRPAARTPDSQTPIPTIVTPSDAGKYEKVSQALLAVFPAQEDLDIIVEKIKGIPMACHQINVKSRSQVDSNEFEDEVGLAKIPSPRTHPVLLAKKMLILSSLLLHIPPHEHIRGLSEHHPIVMERLAEAAINLVTTSEELLGTIESLECLLLEASYHLNCGNVRRAWLAFRRAMGAAQLMGIYRPRSLPVKILDPSTNTDPQIMWFRIVYMERFLSLMLGLPQGYSEANMESDQALAGGDPSERLERLHAVISARILERNQLGQSQRAMALTLDIDRELRTTAEGLPPNFWAPPDFAGLAKDSLEAFRETMRVRDQIFHYTLLNQLHLPFLLCPSDDRKHDYSRVTCAHASREIMTRFITFRTFNSISACCRLADFLALVAGMTLILAHLDSRRRSELDNLLAHQRLGDRATVEQVLEKMEVNSKLNEDMLAIRCADVLQRLLDIEAEAAQGQSNGRDTGQRAESHHEDECNVVLITVPYFGTVKLAREGIMSVETLKASPHHTQDLGGHITIGGIGSVHVANPILPNDSDQPPVDIPAGFVGHAEYVDLSPPSHSRATPPRLEDPHAVSDPLQLSSAIVGDDFMQQQDLYPGAVAGMNDWAFQGVDTAFFDSLMMQMNVNVGDGGGGVD